MVREDKGDVLLYFFFGRPLALRVCSRPRRSAVSCCHLGVPKERSRATLVSIDSSSTAGSSRGRPHALDGELEAGKQT